MSSHEIIVRIDRKALTLVAALILIATLCRLLWSEALNLVTTYPAPAGIYNTLVTTGDSGSSPANTTFNRNAGNTILVPPTNANGRVGIGTTNPAAKLDINGALRAAAGVFSGSVQLGDDASACIPPKAGTLRWNGTNVQFCSGSAWQSLAVGAPSAAEECATANGAWVSGPNVCYFSGASCPAGWSQSASYTSTQASTCGATNCCPYSSWGCASTCSTGSHNRKNQGAESCLFAVVVCGGLCKSACGAETRTCVASVTEVGCSKNL